jgi:hypothetical protein
LLHIYVPFLLHIYRHLEIDRRRQCPVVMGP